MVLVTTIRQMLSIADAMERGAAERYEAFAACMRRVGHADLADVFDALALEERQHVDSVEKLAQASQAVGADADITGFALPAAFEVGDVGSAALLTPYKALSIAVRCEEEAFTFWAYVASEATNVEVRTRAEAMARQELVHASKLRHQRRRAYHAEKQQPQAEIADALDTDTMRAFIGRQEDETAEVLHASADRLDGSTDADLVRLMRGFAVRLADVGRPVETISSGAFASVERAAAVGPVGILFEAAGSVENLLDQYLVLIRRGEHFGGTDPLESRCEAATAIIANLNACLYALEPSLKELANASGQTAPGARHA
jgi:rubrerythrin